MNGKNDTTAPAVAPALPKFDGASLTGLSIADLRSLHGAVMTMQNVGCGLESQPRFWADHFSQNAAGKAIATLIEFLNDCEIAIVDAIEARQPETADEVGDQAYVRLASDVLAANSTFDLVEAAGQVQTAIGKLAEMGSAR